MLYYFVGNALEPVQKPAVILHICNDIGACQKYVDDEIVSVEAIYIAMQRAEKEETW